MPLTTDSPLARKATWKVAVAGGVAVLLLAASACGSDGNNSNGNATGQTGEAGPKSQQQGGTGGNPPGVNGKVAAVSDSTAQVQGMQGQVAVTWNATTTFTKDVSTSLADVKVGSCVLVRSDDQQSAGSTPATAVTASSVRITPKANGSCGLGLRGPGGGGSDSSGGGPQFNGTPPEGAPTGGSRPQMRGMGGAVGEVTAVSPTGFTVSSVMPGNDAATPVTVTVGSATTYTTTASAAAADVKVGVCVTANGTTDDTGAVTAKTIAVSQPENGQCGGFVQFKSGDGSASTQES